MARINETQVRYALELMKKPQEVVEVRITGQKTFSGYFKSVDNLIEKIRPYYGNNIYFVMNEIKEECYDREQREEILASPKYTTSDKDIAGRRWLLVDIDSNRSAGVGATEEEKSFAKAVGNKVFAFLRNVGFSEPIVADSGNGVHLLYSIELANTAENTDLVRNVLLALDMFFSDDMANIDTSVFNASRITKLYGTIARKGRDTRERPHRESRILRAPGIIKVTDISLLRKVADMLPKEEKKGIWNNYGADRFNVDDFISRHGIDVKKTETFTGGKKYILDHCLFDESHRGKDAAIFVLNNGAIGYKCFHSSCSGYKWQDVRRKFEPNAYDKRDYYKNEKINITPQPKKPQIASESKGKKFLQLHEIEDIDRSKLVYIKTHITELDKKIIGFLKGDTSMWSGTNGSGKSTILGQIALNAVNDGFKVLMYSGELQPHRVKNWLRLQAAGRQFTKPTDYENFFYVPNSVGDKIDLWLKDKFFLYNNNYGNEYNQLIADLSIRLDEGDIDMVILDNIMTLDLDELANDENSKQKNMILSLSSLAKKYNIHIHVVAHPKKTVGLLRKNDISGTLNLSNVIDNVFIIHRVCNDFIRASNEYFGAAEAAWMHRFSNIIEVCKNRDLGVIDYMTGIYFEKESKRFLNEPFDNVVYGWQEIGSQKSIDYQFTSAVSEEAFMKDREPLPFMPSEEPLPF